MTVRVDTEWTGVGGSPYYTSLHFEGDSELAAGNAYAGVVAWLNAIKGSIRNDMVATVQPEVSFIDVATGLVTATELEAGATIPMTGSGARQPLVCQGLIRLRTGVYVNGREIRGKIFIPGALDAADTDGVPAVTYRNTLQAATEALLPTGEPDEPGLQVYSPKNGQAANVTGVSVWNQWAILRSRRD